MKHFLLEFQRVFDECEEGNQNQRNELRHMAKLKIKTSFYCSNQFPAGVVLRVGSEHVGRSRKGNAALLQDLENSQAVQALQQAGSGKSLCCNCFVTLYGTRVCRRRRC